MSKRRGHEIQSPSGGGGGEKRPCRRQRHLYLVLDDWVKGFSIYKLDDEDQEYRAAARHHHLPDRPAARLEAPGANTHMLFAALGGSKILAVTDQERGQTPALVFDARAGCMAFGPQVPARLERGFDAVVEARGALYAFSSPSNNKDGSFEVMSWAPGAALDELEANPRDYTSEEFWGWKALPGPPPPHDRYEVIGSHAVHPDGRTVFLTTVYRDRPGMQKSTYSFDTRRRAWRWHAWALPFDGAGHFDAELDAWVGIDNEGHVRACPVPDARGGSKTPVRVGAEELDWREVGEKMFCKDPERHVRASLASMGGGRFCLVESVGREDEVDDGYGHMGEPDGSVLYITMFGLKYNYKGELRTTELRSTRSYLVSKHKDHSFAPVAFWM